MESPFGVVNIIATAFIILITLLNIIVYKLRQLHEANFGNNSHSSSSSQQLPQANAANLNTEQHHNENLGDNSTLPSSLKSENLCRHFPLGEILVATNYFDDTLVIGQGGFGKVYKGVIDNGAVTVAIKRLNPMSRQGAPEFWTEVELLSRFRHSHLVSLIGYCNNRDEMILVYEYMSRGSLADHLYKAQPNNSNYNTSALSWVQRLKICIGAGQGLDYLHTGTGINDRVIHRDLKSSNILLDDSWAAKVSDFGLSKIGPANQNSIHVSTNVKGTPGYLDPEYLLTHRLTRKSDVYSFGVVLLEVLSGRRAVDLRLCEEQRSLAGWTKECIKKGEVDQIIDPYVKHEIFPNSLKEYVHIAEKCLHYRSKKRPTMAEVVASLESALALQERRDSSMFDEDFLNLGWTLDNQENPDDSTVQGEVNSGGNGGDEGEVIDNNVLSGDARNSQSRVKRTRIIPFKRMARFLFGKSQVESQVDSVNETRNLGSPQYDFDTLKAATDNFSLKLGEGGFGNVYKGVLPNGQEIAVKKFSSDLAESEFRNRISLEAKFQHRNLVRLLGFCSKGTERLLVYEFVPNSSLDNFIYDPLKRAGLLDWEQCHKIIRGVSRGILYLHEDSPERIIHRNLKPINILLDWEQCHKAATDKFSFKRGAGGFGVVYKGLLPNGQEIAVKKFSSDLAESEFRNRISLVAKIEHRNLVRLLGFCSKGTERLLAYEFVPSSSLDNFIYGLLDWEQCHKIIRGVSRGILYLHEDSPEWIIHRNLKPPNILLDSEMSPKISGFGLAMSLKRGESGVTTKVCGTIGYIAPEYIRTSRVSVKSDVYSFGILVLEIISGRRPYYEIYEGIPEDLRTFALRNWREGTHWNIIGPHMSLSGSEVTDEIKRCIHIALLCTQENETDRPTMSSVVLMLNNPSLPLPEPSKRISFADDVSILYYDD